MIKTTFALAALVLLAACGSPQPPEDEGAQAAGTSATPSATADTPVANVSNVTNVQQAAEPVAKVVEVGISHRRIGAINNCQINEVYWKGRTYLAVTRIPHGSITETCALIPIS